MNHYDDDEGAEYKPINNETDHTWSYRKSSRYDDEPENGVAPIISPPTSIVPSSLAQSRTHKKHKHRSRHDPMP